MPLASLSWAARPQRAGVVVLVMHGGARDGLQRNRPWSFAAARLLPFGWALKKVNGPVAVVWLRFHQRGWNGAEQSPVGDARWALGQIRAEYPGVPIALVGHSMGGRTAMYVAGEEGVRLVVGLATWIERGDPRPGDGQRTVLIHGDRDRICPIEGARLTVETMRRQGSDATLVRVRDGDHAMLRRASVWHGLVAELVAVTFADELDGPGEPQPGPIGSVVARVLHTGTGTVEI